MGLNYRKDFIAFQKIIKLVIMIKVHYVILLVQMFGVTYKIIVINALHKMEYIVIIVNPTFASHSMGLTA
jgi:hypothetical protein